MERFSQKITKIFVQHSQQEYKIALKENDIIGFLRCDNFDMLERNGTKYWLIFQDSSGKIYKSKNFADNDVAEADRAISVEYNKRNLFHQSILHKSETKLFNFPCDTMKLTSLISQIFLELELTDLYRSAKFVPTANHWKICGHDQMINFVTVQRTNPLP